MPTSTRTRNPLDEYDVTLDELCEMGQMSKDTYRYLKRQGKTPPAVKVGKVLKFRRRDVIDWVRNVRMKPAD